jgi:hypothetical protein
MEMQSGGEVSVPMDNVNILKVVIASEERG